VAGAGALPDRRPGVPAVGADVCLDPHGRRQVPGLVEPEDRLPVRAAEHKLVAPTLVRSRALSALYEAARRGEISAADGIERVTRINSLKVRFLGDKVLQRQAWKVADELGWETTYDAEYVALARVLSSRLLTLDARLRRTASRLVEVLGPTEL